MFCPRCEINYHTSLEKCVNCNTKLLPGIICMDCGTKNHEKSRTCNLCGKLLTSSIKKKTQKESQDTLETKYERVCPNGHINNTKNIFCSSCGEFLELKKSEETYTSVKRGAFSAVLSYITGLF